jgi:omega-6 fatty acid desaturase (delta-12 desaturase)
VKLHARADAAAAWRTLALTAALQATVFALHAASLRCAAVALQAGTSVRAFIIFHDACHASFFPSPRANAALGRALSAWTLTPFDYWRDMHLFHHAHSGDLAVFDAADTVMFTAQQYRSLPLAPRVLVRVLRDPLVFHLLVPALQWFVLYPVAAATRDRYVVAGHVAHAALAWRWLGWAHYGGLYAACVAGVALFHLQHAANPCSRTHAPATRCAASAALRGSTHLRVPPPLAWATLGIEFHHVHHLDTRVPSYRLAACHASAPPGAWDGVTSLGAAEAAVTLRNVMYDENTRRMVPFGGA